MNYHAVAVDKGGMSVGYIRWCSRTEEYRQCDDSVGLVGINGMKWNEFVRRVMKASAEWNRRGLNVTITC